MRVDNVQVQNPFTLPRAETSLGVIPARDAMASAGEGESCGSCVSRWLCFFPNQIWKCFKKIINFISCNKLCVEKITKLQVKAEIERVLQICRDPTATLGDREAAIKSLSAPAREKFLSDYVENRKAAQLGEKPSEKQSQFWDKQQAQTVREAAAERLDRADVTLLQSYLDAADDNG